MDIVLCMEQWNTKTVAHSENNMLSVDSTLWMNNDDRKDDEWPPYSPSLAAPPATAQQKAQVSYDFGGMEFVKVQTNGHDRHSCA